MKEKLKVVTTFSGIGFQERGLRLAGYDLDVINTCETDIDAIVSYAAIHNGLTTEMVQQYENYPSREEMVDWLEKRNIGYNFDKNKPYDWQKKIKSKKMDIETCWLACQLNKNVGDICKTESFPYCDLLTYSSPCQSYSQAGRQEGTKITCNDCGFEFNPLDYDVHERCSCPKCNSINITSTRSGLMAEIERIVLNMIMNGNAPKFLLQENVDALVSKKFMPDFQRWIDRLDKLGYNTYWTCINTKHCSYPEVPTPQNRNRLFSLSVRKDIDNGKFEFPKKFDAGIRLEDILLDDVEEKYFITNPKAQELIDELVMNGILTDEGENE